MYDPPLNRYTKPEVQQPNMIQATQLQLPLFSDAVKVRNGAVIFKCIFIFLFK